MSDIPKLFRSGFKGCISLLRIENKKIVDDDSGLGGFGADLDFTDDRLVKDWDHSVKCVDECKL